MAGCAAPGDWISPSCPFFGKIGRFSNLHHLTGYHVLSQPTSTYSVQYKKSGHEDAPSALTARPWDAIKARASSTV